MGDLGSIPGSGRSPREGNGDPLQYSYLENPMDGGTWLGYIPWGRKELDITEQLSAQQLQSKHPYNHHPAKKLTIVNNQESPLFPNHPPHHHPGEYREDSQYNQNASCSNYSLIPINFFALKPTLSTIYAPTPLLFLLRLYWTCCVSLRCNT